MLNITQFLDAIRNLDLLLRETFILIIIVIAPIEAQLGFTKNKVDFFCNAVFFGERSILKKI